LISINIYEFRKYNLTSLINKFLIFFGSNSLIILAIHQVTPQLISFYINNDLNLTLFYFNILQKILALILMLIIIVIINSYAPFLTGKKLKSSEHKL